jgi:hypothetical protein
MMLHLCASWQQQPVFDCYRTVPTCMISLAQNWRYGLAKAAGRLEGHSVCRTLIEWF